MSNLLNKKNISALLLTTMLTGASGVANAQIVTDEIIVTAQKKSQNLQDVGIAVTAYNAEQIEALGFQSTTDIVYQTPGLQLYEFSPSITVYNIRGVSQNSFSDNLEGPIAVYIDEAYVSALGAQNQPIFDVERVEILKGPQGTLYGRNATGGLIHYISKKPTEEFEVEASASYGSFNYHEVEAAVSGGLGNGLRGRLAFVDTQEDGYLESTNSAVRDAYGKNSTAVKGIVELDIGESSMLTINPYWSKDSDVPTGAYVRIEAAQDPRTGLGLSLGDPADPFLHSSDKEGRFDREIKGVTAKFEHDFANDLKLTSITNFNQMDKFYTEDSEGRNLTVADIFPGLAGAPFSGLGVFGFTTDQEFEQFSQELRLSGDTERLSWQAGAYYLDIKQSNLAFVEGVAAFWTNDLGPVGPSPEDSAALAARNDFNLDAKSISVFAQGDFAVSDKLKLIAGLRVVKDDKDFDAYIRYQDFFTGEALARGLDGEVQFFLGAGTDGTTLGPICYSVTVDPRCAGDAADPNANFEYTDWAGKLQLDYAVSDDTLLYAGVNRGTKGGNWATPSFPDSVRANGLDSLSHSEETLWSYEAGVKHSFANGRFNAAVFYYDYEDYQAFSLTNFVQNITNNDATVIGAEFELAVNPIEGLDLMFGGSLLGSEVEGIATPNGTLVNTEMPNAPSASLNGLARYGFEVGNGELSFQVDGNYNGSQFLEVTNPASSKEDAYFVGNARIAYAMDNGVTASVWSKNILDTEYRVYSLDVAGAPEPFINDVYARPRTFGATLSGKF